MFSLYVSMVALGLAAVDPTGIAAMPLLLSQPRPYWRSALFLGGSFLAIMVMGLLFAQGLGGLILRFDAANHWLVPVAELIAGLGLLGFGTFGAFRLYEGRAFATPAGGVQKWLMFNDAKLLGAGALLVTVQSLVDVVFLVATVHVGRLHPGELHVVGAIAAYAVAALLLQLAVVVAFAIAKPHHKAAVSQYVRYVLERYSGQVVTVVSLLLGGWLLYAGLR